MGNRKAARFVQCGAFMAASLKRRRPFCRKNAQTPGETGQTVPLEKGMKLSIQQEKDWTTFAKNTLQHFDPGRRSFFMYKNELFLLPFNCPQIKGLRLVRCGLHLGTFKKTDLNRITRSRLP